MSISIFPTMSTAQSATLAGATSVQLMGYYNDGDCGGWIAVYENVGTTAPSLGTNGRGWFESADNYYFVLTNDEIDPRMFGAKADGSTDNAATLNALEAWCGVDPTATYYNEFDSEPGTKTIVFQSSASAMCIGSPVLVFSGVKHRFEAGAEVRALSGFAISLASQTAMFVGYGTYLARWVTFEGPGTINCNKVANLWAIQAYNASSWTINGKLRIVNTDGGGILGGSLSGTKGSGYNVNIDDVRVSGVSGTYPFNGASPLSGNNPAGVGVYYKDISDSRCHRVEVIGLQTGCRSDQGDTTFDDCHCWTSRGFGPLVYGFCISNAVECVNCYADTVTPMQDASITVTYGFYSSDGGGNCVNCSVFLNYDDGVSAYTSGNTIAYYNAATYIAMLDQMTVDGGIVDSVTADLQYAAIFGGGVHDGLDYGVIAMARTIPVAIYAGYVALGDEAPLRECIPGRSSARKLKNYFANPALQLWQRWAGSAITIPTGTTVWAADRWFTFGDGTATRTVSQVAISAADRAAYGIRSSYAMELSQSSPSGSTKFYISQRLPIETLYALAGKMVTFQFKAKLVSGTFDTTAFAVSGGFGYGSGGSAGSSSGAGFSIAPTSDYQTYYGVFPMPSLSGVTIGTGPLVFFNLDLPTDNNYVVDICDLSLTVGTEQVVFEVPDPVDNELECFNYYEIVNAEGFSGTAWYGCTVPKRNSASLSIAHGGAGSPAVVGSVQQSGALVSDTATETLTLTFSCSEP